MQSGHEPGHSSFQVIDGTVSRLEASPAVPRRRWSAAAKERIVAEAYNIGWMNFWGPDPADPSRIVRRLRTADYAYDISEFPHLIVNQARVLDYFAEAAAQRPHQRDAVRPVVLHPQDVAHDESDGASEQAAGLGRVQVALTEMHALDPGREGDEERGAPAVAKGPHGVALPAGPAPEESPAKRACSRSSRWVPARATSKDTQWITS